MFTKEELELQYTPRKWAKRVEPERVIPLHIEFSTKASEAAKKNIPCQLEVSYGDSEREKLDIYGIDLPADSPILIFLHGGYWQQLSRETSGYIANNIYKYGIKVIIIGYDLCPTVAFETLVGEIPKAVEYCLKYAKTNGSSGLYLSGHSAGAHLVASTFQQSYSSWSDEDKDMIKGAFLISGIFDLVPLIETTVNNNLKLDEEVAKKFSPLLHPLDVPKHTLLYVIVGEYESSEFQKQSSLLHNKLKSSGYKSELIIAEKVDHFNIVENLNNEDYEILKLILKVVKL
ncbi:hypothetical protein FQR65_LT10437 [Abscondita terminalis]|nr:hypothetical protein FQR65_LT10437 [Abscondita terminalis]